MKTKRYLSLAVALSLFGAVAYSGVQAAEPADLYSHEHHEVSSQTVSSETTSYKRQDSAVQSTVSMTKTIGEERVSQEAGKLTAPYLPQMKLHQIPYAASSLPEKIRQEYDRNYKDGVLARVKVKGKWGLIGTNGQTLIVPQYKELAYDQGGIFLAKEKKDWTFVDKQGRPLPETATVTATTAPSDEADVLLPFKDKGKYGFLDRSGNVVIAPAYKEVYTGFSEGLAFVKNQAGKKVAIDRSGAEVFVAPYDELYAFDNGLAEYRRHVQGFNWGSLLGVVIGSSFNTGYDPGLYGGLTYDGVKRGYIDRQGHIVIDSKLDEVYPMTAFGTFVKNKGKLSFVNRQGQALIGPADYVIDQGTLDDLGGLVSLKDKGNGKYGVFSMVDGAQVAPFAYDAITFLGSERMLLQRGETRYLVDETTGESVNTVAKGITVMPFGVENRTWRFDEKKNYAIIDQNGQVLFTAPAGTITKVKNFRNGVSPVQVGKLWGVVDGQGRWLVQPQYDDLDLV